MFSVLSGSPGRGQARLALFGHRRKGRSLRLVLILAACSALAMLACVAPAGAADRHPFVVPPFAKSYDILSVAWWQWALRQPIATNPLTDDTGARCGNGQFGPVFFIGGDFNGNRVPITRDQCKVPAGKALFFPMVNAVDVHVPGLDTQDTPQLIWDDLQVTSAFSVSSLHASIDGVDVRNLDPATTPYRGCAGPVSACAPRSFSLRLPADNLFGIAAGVYRPAVADGFYLLLAPLKPGPHTITFGGQGHLGTDFSQDITYQLTVMEP
jgi:hypothetical protein